MSTLAEPYTEREGSEFAHFDGFCVEYRDASHRYFLHYDEKRIDALSVTSALKIIDKPALVKWAERAGVEAALEIIREIPYPSELTPEALVTAVRSSKLSADAKKKAGGGRGTAVHEALRVYCEGGSPPDLRKVDREVRGYVQGLSKWLLAAKPEPVLVEQIIGSKEHGYAGRFDLLANIDGKRVLCDLKTAKRPYAGHSLQLGAYMYALEECFGETCWADAGMVVLVTQE